MNISPLQLKHMAFDAVSVTSATNADGELIPADSFDFSGVKIVCEVGYGDISQDHSTDPFTQMLLSLRTRIDNKEGHTCPYNIDVRVSGVFQWTNLKISPEERQDLIVVNGTSLLFGAVREMVTTVTSRSVSGQLILPCFSFLDNKPSLHKDEEFEIREETPSKKSLVKKLASSQTNK